MIILLACLGSFAAGIAVGMLIVYLYWRRIERELNEAIEKTLNKCNLTLDK
nr:MAG TPA: Lipopolysaccharide assembly protein A domain [Caudoviricetes sp.]